MKIETKPEIIKLTPKHQGNIERLASSRRRAAVNYLDNMDEIHSDVMQALTMAHQAREGYFEPVISAIIPNESVIKNENSFYKSLNTYKKVNLYYSLQERIFGTLIENKGELDHEKQMKEVKETQSEMSKAAKILDIITHEKIKLERETNNIYKKGR